MVARNHTALSAQKGNPWLAPHAAWVFAHVAMLRQHLYINCAMQPASPNESTYILTKRPKRDELSFRVVFALPIACKCVSHTYARAALLNAHDTLPLATGSRLSLCFAL
eukprot:2027908-Amphidinium_carterae.1